jgi:hypothetical protein
MQIPDEVRGRLTSIELRCLEFLLRYRRDGGLKVAGPVTIDSISAAADEPEPPDPRQPFFSPRGWLGITAEAQCVVAALSRKLGVALPYGSGWLPFDFFIFTATRAYRVQVKYGSKERNAGWRIMLKRSHNDVAYKKGDFDVLAATGPDGVWYLIPFSQLKGCGSIRLPRRKRMKENDPGTWFPIERYRERWEVFR